MQQNSEFSVFKKFEFSLSFWTVCNEDYAKIRHFALFDWKMGWKITHFNKWIVISVFEIVYTFCSQNIAPHVLCDHNHNKTDIYRNFSMTVNLVIRMTTTKWNSLKKVWKWQCLDCEFLEIWEWLKITRGLYKHSSISGRLPTGVMKKIISFCS